MRDLDLFDFFRYALGTVVTIYATVVMLQSLWSWYVWLAGSDKYMTMLRRYVIVHGLRVKPIDAVSATIVRMASTDSLDSASPMLPARYTCTYTALPSLLCAPEPGRRPAPRGSAGHYRSYSCAMARLV